MIEVSKFVTDWARDLAERMQMVVSIGVGIDADDVTQLLDLADTLDEWRSKGEALADVTQMVDEEIART